jgi:cell division septum initiation protein DivIVA
VTAHSLRRVDELLVELVETVETARAVPMSGSCVVPRERTLDLLDALHESFPAELTEARQVLAQRDALLADANQVAAQVVADAEVRAHEIMEAGRAEHAELVSASRVHQTAAEQATQARAEADQYVAELRDDATSFADQTLADLVEVLQQATATAQQGRTTLAERREGDHERDERSREEPAGRYAGRAERRLGSGIAPELASGASPDSTPADKDS